MSLDEKNSTIELKKISKKTEKLKVEVIQRLQKKKSINHKQAEELLGYLERYCELIVYSLKKEA